MPKPRTITKARLRAMRRTWAEKELLRPFLKALEDWDGKPDKKKSGKMRFQIACVSKPLPCYDTEICVSPLPDPSPPGPRGAKMPNLDFRIDMTLVP